MGAKNGYFSEFFVENPVGLLLYYQQKIIIIINLDAGGTEEEMRAPKPQIRPRADFSPDPTTRCLQH